ncbi:MAG TPA: pitrilysin family protein [Candidatus Polarisedimenticolaceae bacterium]
MRRSILLVAALQLLLPPVAAQAPAKPSLDIKTVSLANGLEIYVLERPASPTFAALYQFDVGGAVDPKGRSGIAHLLEHMMFKGTPTLGTTDFAKEKPLLDRINAAWMELQAETEREDDPFRPPDKEKVERLRKEIDALTAEQKKLVVKNEFDQVMTRAGSVGMNASTSWDQTNYYMQLPANRLELWFRMEADRILNPVFREFWSERDVVHEERRLRTENSPQGTANEALMSLLFPAHPYGTPVVGWPSDVAKLTHDDAMAYFRTYYSPTNCTMVLVGDVKTADVERLAKKYFGSWKRQTIPPKVVTREPDPRGERRRVVEFDAEPSLRMAWPTVRDGHPDSYALEVLGSVLGGLDSSRLDKTIVQKERLAASVGTGQASLAHGGWFSLSSTPKGETPIADLEKAIDREIKRIQDEPPDAAELDRAKIQVEVSRATSLKSNLGLAFQIADSVSLTGGIGYMDEYERRIRAVTAQDVQRVAKQYLAAGRRSVVEVRKTPGGAKAERGADTAHARGGEPARRGASQSKGFAEAMTMLTGAAPVTLKLPEIGKDVERVVLPSGVTVFIREDHSAPTVEMGMTWLGGSNAVPVERLAPYSLATQLLNQGGTESLTPEQLDERKEDLGMSFSLFAGSTECGGSFFSLSRNFDDAFGLAMEMLRKPRFDPGRLDTIRGQFIEGMKRRWDSPGSGAGTLQGWIFNASHPRLGYVPSRAEIEKVTAESVREVWERHFGRDNLYVAVVGDFDRKEMLGKIDRAFAGWRSAPVKDRVWITREPVVKPGAFLVEKEIPQPAIRLAHQIPVDRTAPLEDHAALEILNDILGGSGFRSRLMERLRSDEGLTYGVSSSIGHQSRPGIPGSFGVGYQTKAPSVARSVSIVLEEIDKIVAKPVSAEEIAEQMDAWRNRFVFRFTNDFSIVSRLLAAELDDRPYTWDRTFLDAVQKVTVEDVSRVAKRYLAPANLTVAVFGSFPEEDRKALGARFPLTVLPKETVFTGGYDAAPAPSPSKP